MREDLVGVCTKWEPLPLSPFMVGLFLEATDLDLPRYSGHGDEPATLPPAILAVLRPDSDALGVPTDAPVRLNGGNRFSWRRPVAATASLERQTRVIDVYEKAGRTGRLEFYVLQSDYRDVDTLDVVASAQATTIRRYPSDVAMSSVRRSSQRDESPTQGIELPARTFVPTTRQLVKYSVATGDYYEAHYDLEYARRHGLPGVLVHGLLKLCLCNRALCDWFDADWFASSLAVEYRGIDLVGEPWTVHGRRTEPEDADEPNVVTVQLTGLSAKGEPTLIGKATMRRRMTESSDGSEGSRESE